MFKPNQDGGNFILFGSMLSISSIFLRVMLIAWDDIMMIVAILFLKSSLSRYLSVRIRKRSLGP